MAVYSVRYFPASHTGRGLATIAVSSTEPMTIGQLLAYLAERKILSFEKGAVGNDQLILINGRSAHALHGENTLLADGDTVSILTFVSGG